MNVGGINTTEACNLSCTMCHFHGPHASKINRKIYTLDEKYVKKFMDGIPSGGKLVFSAHGEFFLDKNRFKHLYRARRMGFSPGVITNGQLLTNNVIDALVEMDINGELTIRMDTINAQEYNSIRRGGDFNKVIDILDYINTKYGSNRPFSTRISSILFEHNFNLQNEYIDFWTGRADSIFFTAEYYNTFKLRNLLTERPLARNACQLALYLNPSGQFAPCCALIVHNRQAELDWLPKIQDCTPEQAWSTLVEMYNDPKSQLRRICRNCDWWLMFANIEGRSPYSRTVNLNERKSRNELASKLQPIAMSCSNYNAVVINGHARNKTSVRQKLVDYYNKLIQQRPSQDPANVFFSGDAIAINIARLSHLESLMLPLQGKEILEVGSGIGLLTKFFEDKCCSVISTEARIDNVIENLKIHSHRQGRVLQCDLTLPGSHNHLGSVDVVFCYGTLYHLSNPQVAIQDLARITRELLLIESCVFWNDNGEMNIQSENRTSPNQAQDGLGCRPARNWIIAELKKYFPFVYIAATQPDHPDFPQSWPAQQDGKLKRSVFVASRRNITSSLLVSELPKIQAKDNSN